MDQIVVSKARYVVSELSREIYSTLDRPTTDLENEQLQISHLISCYDINVTKDPLSSDLILIVKWLKALIAKYVTFQVIPNLYYVPPQGNFFDVVLNESYLNARQTSVHVVIPTTPAPFVPVASVDFTQLTGQLSPSSDYTTGIVPGLYNNFTVNANGRAVASTNVAYLTQNEIITLTGFITGTSVNNVDGTTGLVTNPPLPASIGYSLIQNVTPGAILGRYTQSTGSIQEIGLGSGLSFINGALTVTVPGIGAGNGLTVSNGSVLLGGALTANTVISGGNKALSFGTTTDTITSLGLYASSTTIGLSAADSALHIVAPIVYFNGFTSNRDDSEINTPSNFLYTNSQGALLSAPILELTSIKPRALSATNAGQPGYIPSYDTNGLFTWSAPPIAFEFGNGLSTQSNLITVGNTLTDDILFDGDGSLFKFQVLNTLSTKIQGRTISIVGTTSATINTVTISSIGAVVIPSSLTVEGLLTATTPHANDNSNLVATTAFVEGKTATFKQIVHVQSPASNYTIINHNLGRYPLAQVINTQTGEVEDADQTHIDLNNLLISFDAPPFLWTATIQ